jgi:tetratricopeptide (TPR) repeat protein
VLVETGHVEEGIGYYRSVLKIMPDNADAYCHLGVAAMIQGRYDQANEFFRRSLAIDPDHPRATAAYQESLGRIGPAPVSGLTNVGGE